MCSIGAHTRLDHQLRLSVVFGCVSAVNASDFVLTTAATAQHLFTLCLFSHFFGLRCFCRALMLT